MRPPPEEPHLGKDKPSSKSTRIEEARHFIEEYANDLRDMIRMLRKKLN